MDGRWNQTTENQDAPVTHPSRLTEGGCGGMPHGEPGRLSAQRCQHGSHQKPVRCFLSLEAIVKNIFRTYSYGRILFFPSWGKVAVII